MERDSHKKNPASPGVLRRTAFGSAARTLTLALATLNTGLIAGVYYAFAVSVNFGLAAQPDTSYVATMNAINVKIENPLFFASFFGALLFPLAALAAHYTAMIEGMDVVINSRGKAPVPVEVEARIAGSWGGGS